MNRTEQKKLRNYALLLNAGKELFAEKGFQNTTIKDITDHCDVGYGTFYLYFGNKNALLEAVVDELAKNLVEYKTVRSKKGLTIRERMYYGTKDILDFVFANKKFINMICMLSSSDSQHTRIADKIWNSIFERLYGDHIYFLKKGYAKPEFSIDSPSWKIYGWTLKGIIEGISSDEMELNDIDRLSKLYADMVYLTFIRDEIQVKSE